MFKKPLFSKSTFNTSTFKDARPKARLSAPQLNKVAIALSLGALSLTGCSAGPTTGAAAGQGQRAQAQRNRYFVQL